MVFLSVFYGLWPELGSIKSCYGGSSSSVGSSVYKSQLCLSLPSAVQVASCKGTAGQLGAGFAFLQVLDSSSPS